jgi:hypothetical protein
LDDDDDGSLDDKTQFANERILMVLKEMWMKNLIETGTPNIENITSIKMKKINR